MASERNQGSGALREQLDGDVQVSRVRLIAMRAMLRHARKLVNAMGDLNTGKNAKQIHRLTRSPATEALRRSAAQDLYQAEDLIEEALTPGALSAR